MSVMSRPLINFDATLAGTLALLALLIALDLAAVRLGGERW